MSKSYDVDSRIAECLDAAQTHRLARVDFRKGLIRYFAGDIDTSTLDDVIEGLNITESKLTDFLDQLTGGHHEHIKAD